MRPDMAVIDPYEAPHDGALENEIELLADLMVAVARQDRHLAPHEVDRALGLRGEPGPDGLARATQSSHW